MQAFELIDHRRFSYNTPTRKRNRKPPIQVDVVAVDDYGNIALAHCRYSKTIFHAQDGVVRGAVMPQVSEAYSCDPDDTAFVNSARSFHEMDSNCNTCKYLQRAKSDPGNSLLRGTCTSDQQSAEYHPYINAETYHQGDEFSFSPEDWCGMPCYVPRWHPDGPSYESVYLLG